MVNDDLHPLLKDRLHRQRSVFTPGHRIRMNVLPMFLNIFVPWAIFVGVLSMAAFRTFYERPFLGYTMMFFILIFWVGSVLIAINRRKYDPDPAWYTFFTVLTGIGIICAWLVGRQIFQKFTLPYYEITDLKVIGHLDASKESGNNVMDAGIVYFADGNKIDSTRSWHFKQDTVYCVAPIIKGANEVSVPETQSFDFWAVGKDCCSLSAPDFRCGEYSNPQARSGIRVLGDTERQFYRLAVEQAETLYDMTATHPIFFEWSQDPLEDVNSLNHQAFTLFVMCTLLAFTLSLTAVACASCKFAWLGRSDSVYGEVIHNDPQWQKGGYTS